MSKLDKIGYYNKETGEYITDYEYKQIFNEEQRKIFNILQEKFQDNSITKDELIRLMKMMRKDTTGRLFYDSFYKVNMSKQKPKGISKSEYGDFFQLLNFLTYNNTLAHKNGKNIKSKDISDYLGFANEKSLKNYFRKLQKSKMVAFVELGGIEYLMINPAYAQRNMKLNYTVFKMFKDDLIEYLDDYTIRLLEIEEDDFEINSIIALDD